MSQLICQNLSIGYDGKTVVEEINFSVERGDYLCIIGENGSGKTTLMKTILGLNSQVEGEIVFEEMAENIRKLIEYEVKRKAIDSDNQRIEQKYKLSFCN